MMKKLIIIIISLSYLLCITLQEAYEEANSYQEYDKYLILARDAKSSGDSILAESYFQHAEHYARILIENGATVNAQSEHGFTPLYMAAQENHEDIVCLLLQSGADPTLEMDDGFIPLDVAMQQGYDNVTSQLIQPEIRELIPV